MDQFKSKQYIITERAHFMCPNMHFGMLVEIPAKYSARKTKETLDKMAEAHPLLKSRIKFEENSQKLYYDVKESSQILFVEKENYNTVWDDYKAISEYEWNPFENGLLKVYSYTDQAQMTLLFIVHHLLGDGRCLLEIVKEFSDYYVQALQPSYVEECLIRSLEDLPKKSDLVGVSKFLIKQSNRQWLKEENSVTYEKYAMFAERFGKSHPVYYKEYPVSAEKYAGMMQMCRENGITINDLLMADMYIKSGVQKIIIAVDIRNKLSCYQKGAYGNYATAMGIVSKTRTTDLVKKAKEVHKLVKNSMCNNRKLMLVLSCYLKIEPTLLDAAAISALDGHKSKAGSFVGGKMFGLSNPGSYSITNLGKIESPNIVSAMFIPPASPAAKLTLGVVTVNNKMRMCTSSYEEMNEIYNGGEYPCGKK